MKWREDGRSDAEIPIRLCRRSSTMRMSCWWAWMQRLLKTRSTSLMSAFRGTISSESKVCRATGIEVSAGSGGGRRRFGGVRRGHHSTCSECWVSRSCSRQAFFSHSAVISTSLLCFCALKMLFTVVLMIRRCAGATPCRRMASQLGSKAFLESHCTKTHCTPLGSTVRRRHQSPV